MEAINKKYNVFDKLDELAFIHISFDGDTAKMYRYLNDHPLVASTSARTGSFTTPKSAVSSA